jgi:5-methylcytosine-specific restriction endonuclease McrA
MASSAGRNTGNYQRMAKAFRKQCHAENARCWLCWQTIDYLAPPNSPGGFSVDHMHPVSTHPELAEVYANFRPSHLDCNVRRGNRAPSLDLGSLSREW